MHKLTSTICARRCKQRDGACVITTRRCYLVFLIPASPYVLFYIILLFYGLKTFYTSRYNRTTGEGPATSKNLTISRCRLMGEIRRRLDQVVQTMTVYFAIQISQRSHIIVRFAKRYCLTLS